MVKQLSSTTADVVAPEGVTIEVKARKVRVKGPRGTLSRDFSHLKLDMYMVEEDGKSKLKLDGHLCVKRERSGLRTVASHVKNMITGVTKGFRYKMRMVYAHFPINVNIEGDRLEIRNFLGEKRVRVVTMLPGVTAKRDADIKDGLVFEGSDVEAVSRCCALAQMSCTVRKKDIRKFLDGVYLSHRGIME